MHGVVPPIPGGTLTRDFRVTVQEDDHRAIRFRFLWWLFS